MNKIKEALLDLFFKDVLLDLRIAQQDLKFAESDKQSLRSQISNTVSGYETKLRVVVDGWQNIFTRMEKSFNHLEKQLADVSIERDDAVRSIDKIAQVLEDKNAEIEHLSAKLQQERKRTKELSAVTKVLNDSLVKKDIEINMYRDMFRGTCTWK